MLEIFQQAKSNLNKIAIHSFGNSYTFSDLLKYTDRLSFELLKVHSDLNETRVAFMVQPGFNYVSSLWSIWQSGGVAVPLCISHPLPSLEYVLEDSTASILIISKEYKSILTPFLIHSKIRLIILEEINEDQISVQLPEIDLKRNAMILYTSGTTNKPKGVVTTHENIQAQVQTLIKAWGWTKNDHVICVLPLHHVHGIINVVCCSMWVGASCTFESEFSAQNIFKQFKDKNINIFMAVPTIYYKLITYLESLPKDEQLTLKIVMQQFRLMVCGSAALPISVMKKWEQLSGQILLERYGMTELGMAISNPYKGERRAGFVGLPLTGVNVKLVDENYKEVIPGEPGEIIVKGKNVFKEYWRMPEASLESFTKDGWFRTGDIAVQEDGYFRIMGRNSIDIIKSGGYKISALEIEEILRQYSTIDDCAVVGINDDEWGELIVAAVILKKDTSLNEIELNNWFIQRTAAYKKPRKYLVVSELPRNAMGKVVKNELKKLFNF
jgi:malonyl-CoA/methylmalonyl-CoA synthetase